MPLPNPHAFLSSLTPAKAGVREANRPLSRFWLPAFAGMTMLFFSPQTHAAEYTYQPEGCEFRMTFPEKPTTGTKCNPDNEAQCHQVSTYNETFALDSALRVTVTCNPAEKNMLERYSGEVMEFTLETMARNSKTKNLETGFTDHGDVKQAVLLGSDELEDGTERVYMAQLWIGKKSVFTVEGEVKGAANPTADTIFSDIMKSVRHESWDQSPEKPAESEEKPEEKED